jgi:hypothetical protein
MCTSAAGLWTGVAITALALAGCAAGSAEAPGTTNARRGAGASDEAAAAASVYARWKHGPPTDPGFFPIGVWLQDPRNAPAYKAAGINVYVGLWKGPTEAQLAALKRHGMRTVCAQNEVGLAHRADPTIIAWMHGDEPDNAQGMKDYWESDLAAIRREWPDAPDRTLERWGTYGPPIPPRRIVADYAAMKAADPARPVLVNFGQGVAWEAYRGRGVRRGHLEDYAEYLKGCDIASYDIYPGLHEHPDVAGKLELTALGVDRLRRWSRSATADGSEKIVWNIIEAAHTVGRSPKKATPQQVRSQVWLSLIHGSRGIVYIVHQFAPKFVEAGILSDAPEDRAMLRAVTALNREIRGLAPVLNSPNVEGAVTMVSSRGAPLPSAEDPRIPAPRQRDPVSLMVKRHGGWLYLFMASRNPVGASAGFELEGIKGEATLEQSVDGKWRPRFRVDEGAMFEIVLDGNYAVCILRTRAPGG